MRRPGPARWAGAALVAVLMASLLIPAHDLRAQPTTTEPATREAAAPRVEWDGVARVVAFADVHGAYTELMQLLRETGIVDAQGRWAAGDTHVVSLGDLLDRGADSRRVMDLLMRLQAEARAAGGQLHVVLGNHEAMNLLGDLRDVHPGEFAAYAEGEVPEERESARQAWLAAQGDPAGFNRQFPPGYFGHRAALSAQGPYGRWLLSLPAAIRINDTLFMHAGPSAALRGMSLVELNLRYRTALTDHLSLSDRLVRAGLLRPHDPFHRRAALARERLAARGGDGAAAELVARFEAADDQVLLSAMGPNWYRGAAWCHEAAEADVLLPALQQFGASRLVVGHTPTRGGRAVSRFGGRVVKLDAGMNHAVYRGRAVALLLQPEGLSLRYPGEAESRPLLPEGLFVAPKEEADDDVQAALEQGELVVAGPRAPGQLDVAVTHRGRRVGALFRALDDEAVRKELAAHRLDRLLGLGLVPATVARQVQGQAGVLQARPWRWQTQADIQRLALRRADACDAERQFQLVFAFDTLVGNEHRSADSLLVDTDVGFVYLTGHDRAFGRRAALPGYLRARPPVPGAELRRRLETLDESRLAAAVGDGLDERERRAVLARRDLLLALPQRAVR